MKFFLKQGVKYISAVDFRAWKAQKRKSNLIYLKEKKIDIILIVSKLFQFILVEKEKKMIKKD